MHTEPVFLACVWSLALSVLLACSATDTPPGRPGSAPAEALTPGAVAAPQVAWEWIQGGALLVDVRTPAEFEQGHLEGAVNIPHGRIAQGMAEARVPEDRQIVLYCRSGSRSGRAAEALVKAGYRKVLNAGGYEPLRQAQPGGTAAPVTR